MNKDTKYKGHNEEYICYLDCVQMLREDSLLKLSNRMIGEAFSMSKMTVINEPEREGQSSYLKLTKVEFLEFLARIADLNF